MALGAGNTAFGHAVLLGTQPSDGQRLETAPREILLHFNEPVAPIIVRVVDGNGATVETGPMVVRDQLLQVAVPTVLAQGTYIVSYRVTSGDSHPVGGAFLFSLGQASAAAAARPSTSDAGWQVAGVALRIVFYMSLLAAAGGALFDWLVSEIPPALRRRLVQSAAVAFAAGAAGVGVHGAVLANPPLSGLVDPEIWRIGATSTRGFSMAFTLPGIAILLVGLARGGGVAAVVGALVALAGFLVTGHAATTDPVWLMAPAMGVHVLTVAFWIGSLAPLFIIVGAKPTTEAAMAVVRFSRVAMVAVGLLLLAGLILAIVQVQDPTALAMPGYGLIFSAKLALVAGLLLLALYNKRRLTPALERGEPGAASRLRRSIGVEMAAVAGILVVTGALGVVPPPRTMFAMDHTHPHPHPPGFSHAHHGDGAEEAVTSRGHKALAHVETAPDGRRHLHLKLTGADGKPMAPLQVSAAISNDSAGVSAIERKLAATGPGEYTLSDAPFTFAGIWTIDVDALVTDFEKAVWSFDLTVR